METVYENVIEAVSQGARCQVDFKQRTLRLNGRFVATKDKALGIGNFRDLDEWLDKVEDLYDEYKYSRPTERSISKERKSRFKALSVAQLIEQVGHSALNAPISRDLALAKLEVFILFSLVGGVFNPEELFHKDWFYQGADKSLIIRKDWF